MNNIITAKRTFLIYVSQLYNLLRVSFANYANGVATHYHFGYCFQTSSKDFIK
jgi:hypothetical protein